MEFLRASEEGEDMVEAHPGRPVCVAYVCLVACPAVLLGLTDQVCAHRVEVEIGDELPEIGFVLDELAVEPSLEQGAVP